MAKQNNTGVYKLNTGYWGFRYVVMINGVRKEARKTKDEFGAPFKTKKEAVKARQAAIDQEHDFRKPKPTIRKTIAEVFREYCENGRADRAYTTKRKQDSIWDNHLCTKFGSRFVDEVSAADVIDYQVFSDNGDSETCNQQIYALHTLVKQRLICDTFNQGRQHSAEKCGAHYCHKDIVCHTANIKIADVCAYQHRSSVSKVGKVK